MNKIFLSFLFVLASFILCHADNDNIQSRPVTGTYAIEWSHKNLIATYLSPLHYTGTTLALSGNWGKALPFSPENAVMHFDGSLEFSDLLNPSGTAKMIGLNGSFRWGMSWRKRLPSQFQITAGGSLGFYGGAYYLLRNGNNPVQAMAGFDFAARASISRPLKLKGLNILLQDVMSLPMIGTFFSPEYGETYYEIYLGNHRGLVHAGWWGNNFRIDNLLSATIDFGKTAMTLGYRFRTDTQWACNLNTKILTHAFLIGIVPGGIGLKKKSKQTVVSTSYCCY